jgi:hypothetical protein
MGLEYGVDGPRPIRYVAIRYDPIELFPVDIYEEGMLRAQLILPTLLLLTLGKNIRLLALAFGAILHRNVWNFLFIGSLCVHLEQTVFERLSKIKSFWFPRKASLSSKVVLTVLPLYSIVEPQQLVHEPLVWLGCRMLFSHKLDSLVQMHPLMHHQVCEHNRGRT